VSLLVCGGLFVEQLARRRRIGGSGLTAALTAARLGADVSLASWVGREEADEAFALLDDANVDRVGVQILDGLTTTYKISDPADLAAPTPRLTQGAVPHRSRPALPAARLVLCFGTPGFDAIERGWLDRPVENATLVFDRQGAQSKISGPAMAAMLPASTRIMLTNVHEVLTETRARNLVGAIHHLPPDGFEAAIVKAGPWGATVIGPGGSEVPVGAYPVTVGNSIGSGDVFGGALGARLLAGDELPVAAGVAAAAAATWVTGTYDQPPADFAEVIAALREAQTPVWVDRRRLEATRYEVRTEPALEGRSAERVARGLRYLGIETSPSSGGSEVVEVAATGNDPVAATIDAAIAAMRGSVGALPGP
jgi:fructose-1-phosphate kinase PfkB-like protein